MGNMKVATLVELGREAESGEPVGVDGDGSIAQNEEIPVLA
jgi:hypothetical protein